MMTRNDGKERHYLRAELLREVGSIVSLLASDERLYFQSRPSGGNMGVFAKKHCVYI